jgi:CubicO group peptidase (beta-lactamase class C family)
MATTGPAMSTANNVDATVSGTCPDKFHAVRDVMAASLASGADVGACFTAMLDGEVLVDIWGGYADAERTKPWERDTVINVWSTTKTMSFLVMLMLHDRGLLSLDAPVHTYWPEFKANGKEGVLVKHLMSHTAGLSGWDAPLQPEDFLDHDKLVSLHAAQAPWWEPGTASGYHAISQGYLLGEVARRVTGVSMGTFFRTEVAEPLGADFHIGTPAEVDDRVALVIPPPTDLAAAGLEPDSIAMRTLGNPRTNATQSHTVAWRRAEIPAANGHGNSRSVALVQSIISGGGERNGIRFLSEATIARIFEEQANGTDLVLRIPARIGMGYGLSSVTTPLPETSCFWGGWGGSIVVADPTTRLTLCYVMNRMGDGTTGDLRGGMLAGAFAAALTAD